MRLGPQVPTTSCIRGEVCGCGITVAVPDTLFERDRQSLPWQTNAWAQSYDRRTLVEGLNAQARFQAMGINRGYIRTRGRTMTMLLVAVALAGYNATHLHDWYVGRGLPEPWQEHLGEPVDERPMRRYTRTRGNRRRGPTPQK